MTATRQAPERLASIQEITFLQTDQRNLATRLSNYILAANQITLRVAQQQPHTCTVKSISVAVWAVEPSLSTTVRYHVIILADTKTLSD